MNSLTQISAKEVEQIGQDMLLAWQDAHGTSCGKAHVILGKDSLNVSLEDAFSPAEREVAKQEKGRQVLSDYAQQLMQPICEQEAERVTAVLETRINNTSIQVDPVAGWIMCIFRLADPER